MKPDRYHLICVAPDGDFVRDSSHPTVESAWEAAADLGSKWFFYPIPLVVGHKKKRIVDTPHGCTCEWIGRTVSRFCGALKEDEQSALDYCNGLAPLFIVP